MPQGYRKLRAEYRLGPVLEKRGPLSYEYNTDMGHMGQTWFSAHLKTTGAYTEGIHVCVFHDESGELTVRLHLVPASDNRPILTYDYKTESGKTELKSGKKGEIARFELTEEQRRTIKEQMHELLTELLHRKYGVDAAQQHRLALWAEDNPELARQKFEEKHLHQMMEKARLVLPKV